MPGLPAVLQCLCLAAVTVTPAGTMAQVPERGDPDRVNPRGTSLGTAVVGGQALYEGVDRPDALVVPFLGYESRHFYLRGLRAGLRAWSTDRLSAGLILQPRLDQLDPDESDALDGTARPPRVRARSGRQYCRVGGRTLQPWRPLGLYLSTRHTWLDRAVSDSPIVDRDRRWSGIAALSYTFH